LFLLAGFIRENYQTRNIFICRGLGRLFPIIGLFAIIIFISTVPIPPFPAFIREIIFIYSTISIPIIFIGLIPFLFFGIVYNLN
jgi:NADH:ubiquinone oxidoreductase subunit 4 (subunit M)